MMRFLLLSLLLGTTCLFAAETSTKYPSNGPNYARFSVAEPPLVPMPQDVQWLQRSVAVKQARLAVVGKIHDKAQMDFIMKELSSFLKNHEVTINEKAPFSITFKIGNVDLPENAQATWQKDESYKLSANNKGVVITAPSTKGFYYGYQTLRQLMQRKGGATGIALCNITDWPDMQIRGFMNDVGRNFMPMELIGEVVDAMSTFKMNVYHFHCTEREGWRLESKIFPELTDASTMTRMPGKFYTQDDFKKLVEACRVRNIMVIPELDMPGHSDAFRKALKIDKMSDEKATEALEKLIAEIASLVPKEQMPYIHVGTDEVKAHEKVDEEILYRYYGAVEKAGRTPICWHKGLKPKEYKGAIEQIWTERTLYKPSKGGRYIDSHETYVNHLDPFQAAQTLYFRRPCPYKFAEGLGFILCSWPDLPIEDPRNQVLQTPVYQSMAFVSEPLWNNPHPQYDGEQNKDPFCLKDPYAPYFNCLPPVGDPLLEKFKQYEDRVLAIRDRFLWDKEFTYVRQSDIVWKVIGPFPNNGDTAMEFPVEEIAKTGKVEPNYQFDGQEYAWDEREFPGGTIVYMHYAGTPTLFSGGKWPSKPKLEQTFYALGYIYSPKAQEVPFWIGAQTFATSAWAGGPAGIEGEWHNSKARFWVNGKLIPAPEWKKPKNNGAMVDEGYHFREPTMISLKKGWNQVLVKSPGSSRRWMFTFAPILPDKKLPMGQNVKEYPGLRFATNPGKAKK